PTPTPTPTPTTRPTLRQGSTGDAVLVLEQRLRDLGYWLSGVDRTFSATTYHAVVALQKAAGLGRDGVVGPRTWSALDRGVRPGARSSSGHLIEIDLTKQLLLVVDAGRVTEIHSTSTGRVAGTTPVGTFKVYRQIDGYRYAPLGTLYRPKYVYGGVAIHGFTSVPTYPASHGCIRLTYPAMDRIWASGAAPVGTTVRIYR
ncbi:MAG: L,D-transpeptidase family protein, partial [Acidimicrobiia bacterium]|nr:L,D-transpeptidase family protein [Acidimicrobiia bacterium]